MDLKNKLNIICFAIIVIGISVLNIIKKDEQISLSERRSLVQFSSITLSNMNTKLDEYISDQFILRDQFKMLKTYFEFDVFYKNDNNDLFVYKDGIVKNELLNEASIIKLSNKINEISSMYLNGMDVYYTIVPDKQNYINKTAKYNTFDFDELEKIVTTTVRSGKYIDIYDLLNYDSYYKTDSHWRQEKIIGVANNLLNNLGKSNIESVFEKQVIDDFRGVYFKQLQYGVESEELIYLTNDIIEEASVFNYELNKEEAVYNMSKIGSVEEYDVFLSGPASLQLITNEFATSDDELIIFRDSFGSSITPLLIEKYKKITLVDTRYISSQILDEFIEFKDQKVLFMYSTMLYNNSSTVK